jgi:hypothetical protein
MKFITGKDCNQTEFFFLDQAVSEDNEVRLIELFVGAIKLSDYGVKGCFSAGKSPSEKINTLGFLNYNLQFQTFCGT